MTGYDPKSLYLGRLKIRSQILEEFDAEKRAHAVKLLPGEYGRLRDILWEEHCARLEAEAAVRDAWMG